MDPIVPGYSRGRVYRAGWALARTDSRAPKVREDLRVLNNWRAAHSFPLNELHHRLRALAAPIGSDTIISQRLKTTPSTLAKLRRFPRMQLARMQDMGGCRAALDTVARCASCTKSTGVPVGNTGSSVMSTTSTGPSPRGTGACIWSTGTGVTGTVRSMAF